MDLFEIIGFLILLLFLLGPLLRKLAGKKKKPSAPPPRKEGVQRPSIAEEVSHYRPQPVPRAAPLIEVPPVEAPPQPHRVSAITRRELHPTLEDYAGMEATGEASFIPTIDRGESISGVGLRYTEDVAYRQYREGTSSIAALLRRPTIGKEMILLHEVLSPPKSLR